MAKIHEEILVIRISKLVREGEDKGPLVGNDFVAGIEAMAAEILNDPAAIVEVVRDADED